jgi:hypothetical protein
MIVYFNDRNQAYFKTSSRPHVQGKSFFESEISLIEQHLKELPIDVTVNIQYGALWITFKDNADEAYFKVLLSDGIDIWT